jgi:phenylacetate-CoA ligase
LEKLDRADVEGLQLRLLRRLVRGAHAGSPFWRRRIDAAGLDPQSDFDLESFSAIESVTKHDFLADQEASPPFGEKLVTRPEDIVQIMETSGTSGIGQERHPLSGREYEAMAATWPYQFYWGGTLPGHRVVMTLPMGLQCGGLMLKRAGEKYGVNSLFLAAMDARRKLEAMVRYQVDALIAVPTYINRLRIVAAEMGIDVRRDMPRLKTVYTAAESYPEFWPSEVAEDWGVHISEWYGTTQAAGNHAFTCEEGIARPDGRPPVLHNIDTHVLMEVIDPATGRHVADGEEGEAVITPLFKTDNPVLRFATGDKVRFVGHRYCGCGRPFSGIIGGTIQRYDDMMKIRGTNLWPAAIDEVVFSGREVEEYAGRVWVDDAGREKVEIAVEFKTGAVANRSELMVKLKARIASSTGVKMSVVEAASGSLPRFDFKVRRWTDERRKDRQVVKYLAN